MIGKLSTDQLNLMFAVAAFDELFYRRLRENLDRHKLRDEFYHYGIGVKALESHWATFNALPPIAVLRSLLSSALTEEGAGELLTQQVSDQFALTETLNSLEAMRELQVRQANKALDALMEQLIASDLESKLSRPNIDVSEALRTAQEDLLVSQASNEDRFGSIFGDSFEKRSLGRFIPTGHALVDPYSGGTGPATGDIIGHAAPRGSGKSTLANQIAVMVADRAQRQAKVEDKPPKWVYIFNYEKVEDPLAHTISFKAHIQRSVVEDYIWNRDERIFSSGQDYKEYELEYWKDEIQQAKQGLGPYPLAERERFWNARKKLAKNVCIADFTGSDQKNREMALGFVTGVRSYIDAHQLTVDSPGVEAVIIDYAGTCVRAHMRKLSKVGDNTERKLIEDLPFQFKYDVANPLNCFCWVSHQLAADEASRVPGTRPDGNKFKDCKAFAENCDFCMVNGLPTRDGIAMFVHSKSRRGSQQPDKVGQLVGDFCNWRSAEDTHTIIDNRAVSNEEAEVTFNTEGVGGLESAIDF